MAVMLRFVKPDMFLDSVLELDAAKLRELRLEHLLLDMDCTLKDYHATEISAEVRDWAAGLQAENITLCILSNGRPQRIGRLADTLGVPFVAKAYKPFPFRCRQALKTLRFDRSRTAVIGDQLFADVLAGRLAGLFTILVRPTSPLEPWFTRVKRPAERLLLRWFERAGGNEPLQAAVQRRRECAVPNRTQTKN